MSYIRFNEKLPSGKKSNAYAYPTKNFRYVEISDRYSMVRLTYEELKVIAKRILSEEHAQTRKNQRFSH